MNINREIRRNIALAERQEASRRIIVAAMGDHRKALREGRTMMTANSRLLSRIRDERQTLSEESLGLFDKALGTFIDISVRNVINPALSSVLDNMGLEDHPQLKRLIRELIATSLSRIIQDVKSGKVSFDQARDCEYISRNIALSVAEAIPKRIFDEFFGGEEKDAKGFALVIKETIANFFAESKNVDKIAAELESFICKVDFSDLLTSGAEEVSRVAKENMGPGDNT